MSFRRFQLHGANQEVVVNTERVTHATSSLDSEGQAVLYLHFGANDSLVVYGSLDDLLPEVI